ncbi:hypothetical protein FOMPIDRAFT_19251, partial [Fomitopsis schrenkii]
LRASHLRGFRIPGAERRLIASLFADDTSTFLAHEDTWGDLWAVILQWCEGSRARFNRDKTEVIPIGTAEYRARVRATRSIAGVPGSSDIIPASIGIAPDGTAIRVLGAWIGNGVDQVTTWTPTIQKVEAFLTRWGQSHPTLSGRKNIVQMGPGGITQYLAMVQGMPKSIEITLTKMTRSFMWSGATVPPVNMDTL